MVFLNHKYEHIYFMLKPLVLKLSASSLEYHTRPYITCTLPASPVTFYSTSPLEHLSPSMMFHVSACTRIVLPKMIPSSSFPTIHSLIIYYSSLKTQRRCHLGQEVFWTCLNRLNPPSSILSVYFTPTLLLFSYYIITFSLHI